jgi:GxxExxY protein
MKYAPVPIETERAASETIGAAIEVHRHLGPGFLEKIYQEALCLELCSRGIEFEREKAITVDYKGIAIPGQRVDLIVSGCVLVELKAAVALHVIHEAKLISYLKTTGLRLGLLLNFHEPTLKQGLKRIVF